MNKESWIINLKFALAEIKIWEKQYIKKQLDKNPDITKEELSEKIINAKRQKFHHQDFLIFEHPDYPYEKIQKWNNNGKIFRSI